MSTRWLTTLIWMLAMNGNVRAQATPTVTIGKVVADANGKATIEVAFRPGAQRVAAFQLDVDFASDALGFSVTAGAAAVEADKSTYSSDPQPGTRRIIIAGRNANAIGAGVAATFHVQLAPAAATGTYPLSIDQIVGADADGNAVTIEASGGAVVAPGEGMEAPVIAAVVNAASYAASGVSPGEIVLIEGKGLGPATTANLQVTADGLATTALAGTVVRFDGMAAPLIHASGNQVSAVVPYGVEGRARVAVDVEYGGIRSAARAIPVGATAPGVFTTDGTGRGQGAIVNEDGSVNGPGNPAARGSVVAIFATGEGQTQPTGVDGLIVPAEALRHPVMPVTVTVGGQDAEVIYAGSAAGQVSGVLQVNARVPQGTAPGDAVAVSLRIGSDSQPGVSLAVR